MVRDVSDRALELIQDGTFDRVWVADLMYDGDRRLPDVGVTDVSLQWDGGAQVAGSGSLRVVWSDDHARSIIPRQIGDWFAPFGAELQVDCIVGAGTFSERIPMGRFVIESVPDTVEASMLWQGRLIHPGESFGVSLRDPLVRVQRDRFPFPSRARFTSAWDEIQSITGMPVVRNVPDAVVPATITHDEQKSTAVSRLFDLLDAWPMVTAQGVLTARAKGWPSPVGAIDGRVSAPRSLSADSTYNHVVVEGKSAAGDPVYGEAAITDGPLRVANTDGSVSPFGRATYRYSSDYLTTAVQCRLYAESLLPRVSRVRNVTREVTEPFNPLRELGDVLTFDGDLVRVSKVAHRDAVTQMTVEVAES